jgi:2-dehydropantoate 2-reductase
MRIAIFGTGGVGGYFGGRLAQAGEEVIFIARGAHLEAIQKHGLIVKSLKGDFRIQPAQAMEHPAQIGVVDGVLLGVKAWQVPQAAQALRPMVGEHTFVVPLQNGVEAPEQLAAVLGKEHVLGGMCQISALVAAPGEIHHVGIEPYVAFGELTGAPSQRAGHLRQAFERAGVKVEVPGDILAAMWTKFMFIASISGMGAVTHAPVGTVRSLPETRELLVRALQEVLAVAQARGVRLSPDAAAQRLAFIDSLPAGVTASMQRDIANGRPSELESQNGAVVRMGRQLGVPTPVHDFLYACLLPQERKARGELSG